MPDRDDSSTRSPQSDADAAGNDEVGVGPASTPLDHPYFLPVVLGALTLWFGYDAFFDEEMQREHGLFNRVGFAILLPLFLWTSYRGRKEMREIKQARNEASGAPPNAP